MGLVGSNATFVRKARRSLHHLLALALAVSTLSAISIAVAPPATAAGAGLSLYIKNESGRTQDFTRNEFTTGTCHTLTTSTIDYQWGSGSPGGSCNIDGFTVYATGQILAPVTGTVNFCAIADDGFYLSINSAVVIDNWIDQGANSNCNSTGTYSMTAGQVYSIKTWMHENGGGATMQLLWSYTGQSSYIAVPASNLGTFCSPSSTSSGGYTILTFTSTTTCAWNVPAGVTAVDALVVGGGGAGGGGIGGGGGAGEFVETTRTGLTSGTQISISVGAGGTSNNNWNAGNAGGQSRFDSVIAYGGGGGGTNSSNPPVASEGPNFGSQGGGGYETGALTVSSRSDGITGYRNNGGSGSLGSSGSATGGGGGGAGGAGGAGTTSSGSPAQSGGAGGAGRSSSITGTATFYAGGGGGGINGAAETPNGSTGASSGNPGTGGSGIGGSGGAKANAAVTGQYGNRGNGTGGTVNSNGSAGAANTGSGGGGASNWVSGGAGGSGVVVIRYLNAPAITLSTSTISATIGEAVTSYSISNSGGTAASYAISPSLAVSGLSFSTSTGLISGTPSATASSATYTITATNSTGTATATFSISSNAGTPSAPTITGITAGNTTLSVAFTAPSSNGGATISNYEYSTDDGANWRPRDAGTTASPLVINTTSAFSPVTLVNGTTYNVQIRAVNSVGNGPATASTSGAPNGCNPTSSTSGGFTVLTFTNTTACQWSVPAGVTSAEVLIVAGGGGGNRGVCSVNYGAGGGGGGVSLGTRSLTPGDLIPVTVGAGGSAALINCGGTRLSDNAAGFTPDSGTDGGSSSFGAFSASGGVAPLRTSLTGGPSGNGLAGGTIGSSGSSCGSHVNNCGAGGGGGAQNAGSGLNGGAGVTSSISGTSKIYGGGGPGRNNTVNGTSGDGLYVAGSTPTANTGGGGSDITAGAAGVVIVRYINAPSISLSTSTISATVGTAITSYSISNSGGAAASYAISPSLADSGLTGLTFSTSTGLISGTPSAVATSSTFSITATNSSGTSTASFSITTTAGSALTPTFGSTTATATGFTVQISNYSNDYTWDGSATASGSVEISDTGLVTVTGVAPGTSSTATITTTRTGYTGGSATVSATSITGSALTPTFGSTTATADGFTVQISNYSSDYTWGGSATASGSVAISGTGLVTVTGVAPGTSSTATITTTRTGYNGGSATVSATSLQAAQTITRTSTSPESPLVSGTYTPTATASSGLTVAITIASGSSSICSIASGVVTFNAAGSCVIQYNQAGNATYAAASQVTETLTVSKDSQSITFGSLSNRTLGSGTYSISATSSSSLTVAFTSATTSICTVATTTITLVTAGTCTINANQAGNTNYLAATQIQQSFTIAPALLITTPSGASLQGTYNTAFTSLTIVSSGGAGTNSFSATGSLPTGVSLSSAGVLSGTPSIAGDFSLTVTVTDANGATATTSSFTISIAKGVSTLSISVPAYTFTGSPQGPDSVTTSGSAGAVTYAYAGRGSTTYASSSTKPTNVGTYTVTATLATDTNFASVSATADFAITAGSALNPSFGSTTATADGFTVQISNYSSDYTWGGSATASGSVAISGTGLVTVTGVAPGTSSTATITTTRTGYTAGSATVSATSISCADGGLCIVGNTGPGGGIVFYVAPSGGTFACGQSLSSTCKYLEAAPITGASAWTDNRYAWSGNINTAIGTTSTEIGTGYSNTLKMVRQSGAGTAGAGSAARNYRGGGLNDWYLPSKDELNQLYINRTVASASDGYWSSSEYNTTGAWDQGFGNGSQGVADPGKQQTTPVRPIRAFGSSAVESAIIYVPAIAGVTAPVRDATPVTTVTAANGYTGTVTWSSSPSTFAAATTYTATITLTAASGFTLTGVTANFFTVTGATSVTHLANSGSITAEFPATEASPALTPTFGSTTATADGFTVQISNYSSDYTWGGTATASGSVAISDTGLVTVTGVASGTSSTATITTTRTSYTGGSATVSATSISSNVATLSALTLTTATLSPTFASGTTSYTASVVNATTSITVTPTRTQANATITVNGTAVTSGSASGAISLNVGANTITVVVTAQDGTTTATYTVTVTRAEATYTITLAAGTNGTGSNQTLTKTNGTSLTLPDSASANGYFTRAGYTVSGWSTSNGGSQTHALGGSFTTEAATTLYPVWTAVSCSPTSSTAFGYTIYKFTTTGTCFWTVPDGITNVDVLVVAGGGGGGYSWGNTGAGGGGGGQVKTGTATLSSPLEVTVGAGGSAGTLSSGRGGSGVNSSAASITALGGTGGCGLAAPTCSVASMATASAAANGGAGAASPGNGTRGRGGGGSSTTVSLSGSETGGVGTGSSYSGTSINYGVGGNGGSPTGSSANSVGSTGSVNTGNGGGGASTNSASNGNSALGANGGAGGSGVVIVRYGNTLTITYNANGGTTASGGSTTTITGGTVSSLATTSRTGYTFNGWFNQASGGIQITTSAGHNYYGNFTLYAQWTANSLTITYDSQNGSAISNGSTTTGGSISVSPGTPTRAGYTFNGWSTTDTGTAVTFPHTHGQTANFTLFAVWNANSLTVTYDSQGGSAVTAGSSQTGASISAAPTAPTRTGYTFTGWSTTSTGSVVTFPYAHGQTANFTLYAIWSANALTVTYDSQGGSAVTSGGSQTGASISAAPTAPTRAGYTFGGWSVTDGGTAVTFPYAHGQTADFTLFAKWSANALTITYNSQGGSAVTSGSVNTAASISSAPTAPTRAGYTFAGWSATDTGTAVTFPYAHGQTADFTLFGKWSANALTITYNSQGGSAVSAGSVNTGASISAAPTAPTRAGYTFGGWSATDTGTAVTFPHAHGQTADFTLFAKWSANALTITYDSKSGSAVSNGTVNTGASILTAPTAPTRTGYTFAGWSATDTGTAVTFPHAHGQTADFTMFAKWTGNTNTITYDSKGGAAVADGSFVTGGSIAAAPTEPIRAGYTLVGWSLTDGGSVISYPYSPPGTSGITLYAIWTGISCSPTSTITGGYTIYTFATAGTCFWSVPVGATDVEILAVAGGGGGGYAWDNAGAGGGAGGQVNTGTATLGSILEVTVGAGGTAGTVSSTRGGSGGNSSALTVIALGGTGGCAARAITCSNSAQATSLAAANGGVGGIGGASGKGGGGSNAAGTLTTTTAGGAGTASNYSGTSATYGVGGTGGTARGLATSTNIAGAAGSANTGNGGGGASAKSSSGEVNGGTGGTGLVVVRIASALTITYDSQSGSAVSNGSTFTGASIATAPTEPTRSNYTFLGWFTATTGGSAISFPYVHGQTANFTLYAKWTLNTYSIVFNANSGLGLMGNQTITHGVATNLNANLYSRANYVFYRWATAADGTGTTYNNLAEITLTAGTTLYAQWTANTYVVTFNYNGGDGGESTATASFTTAGAPITLPVPTKTGFTFAGWHSDAALTTAIGSGGGSGSYSPTGAVLSLNAYAKWTAINYTFTYNSNSSDSGNVPTESSKQITQTATVKANTGSLVRAGYTFSGWNTASDGTGTNYLSGSLFTVGSANVILYAKWSANTYTVTYNTNGGTGNAQRSSSNVTSDTYTTDSSPVVFPGVGTLTRSGYTFGGWNTSAAGTGTNYVATNAYTTVSNVIFYAKWNPVTYTITYNGNQSDGGTTPTAGEYTTGQDSPYVVLSNSFTKTLNVFGGWNTSDNGTGTSYSPGASITTLVDIVLYAVWIPQYTLHYAINGGSVTSGSLPGDQLYNTGTLVGPLFSAVSRTGYTFGGWVNGSTTIVPNGNFTILADSVLTAKWTPINYTISYNSDGGSEAPETSTRQIGQSFTVGAAVSKPGYNFTGWTTDNTVVGADAVVVMGSANIAYTALWVAKVYTISYDWNGGRGTAVADVNYTFGTTAITLPLVGDRVKDGYTFAGWSESSSESLLSATYIPSQTRTLYAQWTVGNFTISYNLSGGTLASASVAVQNGSSTVLPLPTRTNFVFDGWHTATTGGSSVGSNGTSFTPSASQTVYARWIQASLFGISNSLTRIGSVVTVANIANTFSGANSNSSVSVSVPENALPAGTTINFDLVGNSSRATGLLPNVNYLISIAISWIAGDGTVPDTVTGKPISVTISNETIKIGATAYAIVNNASTLLGTATQDRTITIVLTSDPEIVIAAVKPSAPLNVAATSNGNQQSVISWSAPSTNGGSAITGYTVTSNTNATCTTSTTSCTISSLAYGTAYTFTVTATNNVGTSDASTSASATTAALYTVTFNAKSGTAVASGSFLTASTVSEPTAPTRTGYSFAGWSATDGGSAVSFPYAPGVTSNITLYARWDALDNAVTFDSKGGSSVSSSIFSSGGTVTEPTAPTRSGFTFAGWAATDTGTAVTFPYAPGVVTDITLYAKWSEIVQNNSGNGGDSSAPAPTPTPAPTVTTQPAPPAPARVTVVGSKEVKIPTIEVTPIAVKPETKPTTIKVDSASKKFVAEVKIVNGKVVLTPEVGFSGKKLVTITITENGLDRTVQIELVVLPEMVIKPTVAPVSATKSTVRWTESPNANSYTIYLEGKKVCSTAGTTCSVNKILGPSASVQIVSNGGDKTLSEKIEAEFKASDSIVVGQIVSPTITKAVLTAVDISRLNKIALIIKSQGFKSVVISEITTTKKTAAMAEARIALIKKYLKDKVGSIALKFEVQAPASRTNLNIISVKA